MNIACGWLYTLHHYGYPPGFEDTLLGIAKAREWGFRAFEMEAIGEENLRLLYGKRHELSRHIAGLGLTLANFVPMLPDVVSLEDGKRNHALGMFEMGAELGATLGAGMLMCDSYQAPLAYVGETPGDDPIHYGKAYRVQVTDDFCWERVWENLVSGIRRCTEIAGQYGLRLGMELRMYETVSNSDAFLRLHEAVGHPGFGAVLDTAHLHAQKEILPLSVEKLGRRIFLVHASDNDGRVNQHLPLGQGTIDWCALYQALRKHSFEGYTILDIGDCPDLESAYLQSRHFLEDLRN